MTYLAIGSRCLIGIVFLVSSISKVTGFGAFTVAVRDMRLLPPGMVRPVAIGVVVAEFAVWVLLVAPVIAGFLVAVGLLVVFAAGIALVVRRGVRASCRCFGASAVPLGPRHVVRNVVLVIVAVSGAAASTTGEANITGMVAAALGGLLLGGLVTVLDDIVGLFQPVKAKEKHHVFVDRGGRARRTARRAGPDPHVRRDQTAARAH